MLCFINQCSWKHLWIWQGAPSSKTTSRSQCSTGAIQTNLMQTSKYEMYLLGNHKNEEEKLQPLMMSLNKVYKHKLNANNLLVLVELVKHSQHGFKPGRLWTKLKGYWFFPVCDILVRFRQSTVLPNSYPEFVRRCLVMDFLHLDKRYFTYQV